MSVMGNMNDASKRIKKKLGDEIGGQAVKFPEFDRLPFGIASLDIALAGGVPCGCVSIVYGPPSGGKTSLSLRLAAQHQKRFPDDVVVWLDVENCWDSGWAKKHGVDVDSMFIYKPTTAEEAADVLKEVAFAEDAGLLVVDSIPALSSISQVDKAGEAHVMAGSTREVSDVLRKIGAASAEHVKRGHRLTTVLINQIRYKIGFVMGNPEILPGPDLQNYMAFLKLRVTAKPKLDKKVAAIPIYSENAATVTKKKFPVCAMTAEWNTILYPYEGWKPLDVNNRKIIEKTLAEIDALGKGGAGWLLWGEEFQTKTAALDSAMSDYDDTVRAIVDVMLNAQEE